MNLVDHLSKQFKPYELVKIAEMAGLAPTSRWGSRKLVDAVLGHIRRNGVPKPPTNPDDAKLLEDFLYTAEITDTKGNLQSKKAAKAGKGGNGNETLEQVLGDRKQPDCYGYADDQAVECGRCELYKFCADNRVDNLPTCYGTELYTASNPECKVCIEQPYCKFAEKPQPQGGSTDGRQRKSSKT